jgi:hypothetical protein
VFCRSRADCERIATKLGCQAYYSTSTEKEEAFAAWVDGEQRTIVATSALGTGIDVAGVELVVHFGRPHGIIDFVQEAGRAGRAGVEQARSIVVLSAKEARWLGSELARESEWNREALRLYLTERRCRRRRLTAIMDGEESGCEQGEGRIRCDLCQIEAQEPRSEEGELVGVGDGPSKQRAEEQARRYSVGPQLVRQRVQEQEAERVRIEKAIRDIGRGCASCWLRGRDACGLGAGRGHTIGECTELEEAIGQKYGEVRRQVQFEKESYTCYRCGRPGDWCVEYSQHQRCTQAGTVVAIAVAVWGTQAGRYWLAGWSQATQLSKVAQWLGQATRVGGIRASRVVEVVERAIRLREEGRFL